MMGNGQLRQRQPATGSHAARAVWLLLQRKGPLPGLLLLPLLL